MASTHLGTESELSEGCVVSTVYALDAAGDVTHRDRILERAFGLYQLAFDAIVFALERVVFRVIGLAQDVFRDH